MRKKCWPEGSSECPENQGGLLDVGGLSPGAIRKSGWGKRGVPHPRRGPQHGDTGARLLESGEKLYLGGHKFWAPTGEVEAGEVRRTSGPNRVFRWVSPLGEKRETTSLSSRPGNCIVFTRELGGPSHCPRVGSLAVGIAAAWGRGCSPSLCTILPCPL